MKSYDAINERERERERVEAPSKKRRLKSWRLFLPVIIFVVGFFVFAQSASAAATSTWSGAGGNANWTTSGNWDVVPVAGNDLVFPATGVTASSTNNDFTAGTVFNSVTINGGGYILAGNSISITTGVTDNNSYATGTAISLVMTGAGSFTKSGTSSTTLSGTNTFTGGVTLNAGILNANNSSAFGTIAGTTTINGGTIDNTTASSITLLNYKMAWNGDFAYGGTKNLSNNTGAIIMNASHTITTNGGGTLTLGGVISGGAVSLTKAGPGTLALSNAANTYTGTTTILGGLVYVYNNITPGIAGPFGSSTSDIVIGDTSGNPTISFTGAYTISRNITVQSGAGNVTIADNGVAAGVISSNVTLNRNIILSPGNAASTLTVSGVISGAYNVTLPSGNQGVVILSGNNTYTGYTYITNGTLRLGGAGDGTNGPLGTTANRTIINSPSLAVLDLNGYSLSTAEPLSIWGTGISSGGCVVNSSTTAATYSGLLQLTAASSIIAATGTINISNVGTITGSGFNLTLGGAAGGTLASVLGNGSGGLTKSDSGTWTLSGANTYTGTTTLNAGTLNINNAQALGTAVATTTINGGTIDNTSSADITTLNYPMQWNGDFTYAGSLHNLNLGTGAVTMSANRIITVSSSTLTVGGIIGPASAYTLTKAGTGTLTLGAANIFTGGVTLNAGQLNINNAAALGTTAGTFTISGGTIDNTSTGDITTSNYPISIGADFTYAGSVHNLNLGAGTITMGANRQITVSAQTLTLGGTLSASSYNLTKAGAGTLTLNGATTLTNLTISAGTLTTASAAFNIAGNWSNSGTFTAGSGTVTFNGTSQTITGTTTFNNFTVNAGDTVTFPSTLTQTFNGTFTAIGTLGSIITINASSLGSAATLSSAGTISCDYLSVADSAAVGGANWQAGSHSTKSGNDVSGWIFPVTTTAPTVTTASSSPISDTSATLNGNITATGGANATVRGFAYGTDSTLTIVIATTTETGSFGTGAYTYFVFSLSCGTTYYSRAYATNSGGTGFGSIVSFITSSCSLSPPVIKFLNGVIKFLNGSIKVL